MGPKPEPELPYWYCKDVTFNHSAANEAIGALRRLEQFVRSLAKTRGDTVTDAQHDWSGRFADDFAREFPVTQSSLTGVADDISRLVGRIHDGITDANEEQARRRVKRKSCTDPYCCHGHR
jgi:hypothetical protein